MSNEWSSPFWDVIEPIETCLIGWCFPCGLYGRATERLRDPTLKDGNYINSNCCLFVLSSYCGLHWVLLMMKRAELREKFGIRGSVGEDCILSCCCPCCVLVQQEKELDAQAAFLQAGPGYQAPAAMEYPQK
ncbi:hypothetical protein ARAM_000765 [Aspergillus rambellii]|uniref:DUF614 domain protein n=1 Tax=Aspergillus rambellii TaxID=308745 RepID=A0A0F8X3A9_9EURO|nr:hypothetical protein ARAM_000765 [Aspergillus rambellii]